MNRARLELASDYSPLKVLRFFGHQYFKNFRYKTGIFGCGLFSVAGCTFVYQKGREVRDEQIRYTIAGTLALVSVELATHVFDTYNMRSKVLKKEKTDVPEVKVKSSKKIPFLDRPKLYLNVMEFLRQFKGFQAVVYGYTVGSIVYFYIYINLL